MIYGYIRVSTDRQTVENQRFEISRYCQKNEMAVNRWIEETISGARTVHERKLGRALKKMKHQDILICSELSRLGRSTMMIMGILNECISRNIQVWAIRENYRLGNDINSNILAFAFGLTAEIERNLISLRTKEALARKRAEGMMLGRPKGSRNKENKLTGKETEINLLLESGVSKCAIARLLGVHRHTVEAFVNSQSK